MNWFEPTEEQQADWVTWMQERPPIIRDLVAKHGFVPWKLYRLKTGGRHRVTIHSFDEPKDGGPPTMKVNVTGEFNLVSHERCVFGIKPEDLEECDLPEAGEPLGSADMSIEEVRAWMANRPS